MLSYQDALSKILARVPEVRSEPVPVSECAGRVTAAAIAAREDSPAFDNSSMDGYAVRSGDLKEASQDSPVRLALAGESAAGTASVPGVEAGHAVRIFTGAPLPEGADAVVMQEIVRREEGCACFSAPCEPGTNVRRRGGDVRKGGPLLPRGTKLGALQAAILAAQGFTEVEAARKPLVSIVATGDELVEPGAALEAGQVRNCSGLCLSSAVGEAGGIPRDLGAVRDEPAAIAETFRRAASGADVLLIGGGVSVGDHDHTGRVLDSLGMKTVFWKVAVKPGKPLLFGLLDGVLVFGLPGNPVSSWASFQLFVRPALRAMLGRSQVEAFPERGRMLADFPACPDRRQLLFCRGSEENAGAVLEAIRPQSSGTLALAAGANAVAFPTGEGRPVKAGETVSFRWISR